MLEALIFYAACSLLAAKYVWVCVADLENHPNWRVKAVGSFLVIGMVLMWPILVACFLFHWVAKEARKDD